MFWAKEVERYRISILRASIVEIATFHHPRLTACCRKAYLDPMKDREALLAIIESEFEADRVTWQKSVPTFHPETLVTDESKKRDVWEDMKQIMTIAGL